IRRVRHALHAAADDDVRLAGRDGLRAERHGFQPGPTHLVDRERGSLDRNSGVDRALAGGVLPPARLQHLAHDRLVDDLRSDAGTLECLGDDDGAELDRREVFQPSAERPDCGPAGSRDDDIAHQQPAVTSTVIRSSVAVSRTWTNARRRSVYVTIPTRWPSTTGSEPNRPSSMVRAACSILVSEVTVTGSAVMIRRAAAPGESRLAERTSRADPMPINRPPSMTGRCRTRYSSMMRRALSHGVSGPITTSRRVITSRTVITITRQA